ncbi:MAG: hypothetical protein WEE03_08820 [Chloroflexota bacterium]
MPGRRLAERGAFVTAVLGATMGLLFLFAPIQGYWQSLVQAQAIWPMPFLAISVWSLAPLISYVGVRRRIAGQTDGVITTALALSDRVEPRSA